MNKKYERRAKAIRNRNRKTIILFLFIYGCFFTQYFSTLLFIYFFFNFHNVGSYTF